METIPIKDKRSPSWESGMLPEPSISFTIPSIHHDTLLECRIYHPRKSSIVSLFSETKAATIAHPYTPMGGCFDDHVLHAAGLEFLRQGYVLGLFNLRGAGASQGHTSWSSKPEQDDYCSFVGFLWCYMNELQCCYVKQLGLYVPDSPDKIVDTKSHGLGTSDGNGTQDQHTQQVLVLGGYSYGSFIVRQLPDIVKILEPFTNPDAGTAAAEIKLRATHLAQEHFQKQHSATPKNKTLTVESCHDSPVYGGDESEPGIRRINHEPRRSFEIVKKSVEKTKAHFSKQHCDNHESEKQTVYAQGIQLPEIRYLLISPLLPPVSALLALSGHWWKTDAAAEERLRNHQSLAIWGSDDFFTSSKKLVKWAQAMKQAHGSRFEYTEFPGVGHFWLEVNAERNLRQAIRSWIGKLDNR